MRKWLPLISICLGTFMLLIDVTIVNVALPSMASSLRTSFTQLQWVVDIYALALAALLLGVGSASDLLGRRNVYICGLVLFALASLTAGISGSTAMLIAARAVQGIGAAAMFATTIALINSSYRGRDRGVAFGVWGAFNGAAAATGPILGGLLTQGLSWRWIFFVNLPISVLAIAVSVYGLAPDRPARRGRIDVWGIAAFTTAAGSVTLALTRVSGNGWTSVTTLGLIGFGLVALLTFIAVERHSARPILDLALLRRRSFSGVLVGALLLSVAAFADLAYVSLWLQSVRAMGPIHAGLTVLPLGGCSLLVSLSVGRFLHSSPRWTISGGLALIGAGTLFNAHLSAASSSLSILPGLVVTGIGVGCATPVLASAALAAVPADRGGMAAGAVNTARQLGFALGIAVLGLICQNGIAERVGAVVGSTRAGDVARAIIGGQARRLIDAAPSAQRPRLDQLVHAAFASGLNTMLLVAGAAGLAGAALAVVALRPDTIRVAQSAAVETAVV